MKTMFAIVGDFTVVLGILVAFGVGNLVMMCSPNKISCVKEVK